MSSKTLTTLVLLSLVVVSPSYPAEYHSTPLNDVGLLTVGSSSSLWGYELRLSAR